MKKRKTVFKAFVDHEKEEAYMNRMNEQGWKLTSVRLAFYTFEETRPKQYRTIIHFAERIYQSTFVRTVTECGCEIAHQTNEGKYILFYINVPVDSENVGFLTDNQSKLASKKRLSIKQKQETLVLFIAFAVAVLPAVCTLPSIIKLLRYAPEALYKLISNDMVGYMLFAFYTVGGIVCGIMSAYLFRLYCRSKREIRKLSSEMQIFE